MSDVLKAREVREAATIMLRLWAMKVITRDKRPHEVLLKLAETVNKLEQEIMLEHDIEGVRYWFHAESDSHFATKPHEDLGEGFDAGLCVEITRAEYLDKMSI